MRGGEIWDLHCHLYSIIGCIFSHNNNMNTHIAVEELDKTIHLFPQIFLLVPMTIYLNRRSVLYIKSAYMLCFALLALPSFHFFVAASASSFFSLDRVDHHSLKAFVRALKLLLSFLSLESSSTSSLNKCCTVWQASQGLVYLPACVGLATILQSSALRVILAFSKALHIESSSSA